MGLPSPSDYLPIDSDAAQEFRDVRVDDTVYSKSHYLFTRTRHVTWLFSLISGFHGETSLILPSTRFDAIGPSKILVIYEHFITFDIEVRSDFLSQRWLLIEYRRSKEFGRKVACSAFDPTN